MIRGKKERKKERKREGGGREAKAQMTRQEKTFEEKKEFMRE